MNPRIRRLAADWEQVKKDFASHKNIKVTPVAGDPPETYNVTYFVNGIHLLPGGQIQTLDRHEVEITLHSEYPRYKPICKILTPIWHPNFRDREVCIGDIWGAGESLSDIIVNIGDMIQYKSWNSYSPLSAEAAQWAIENKHIFPVGNVDLYPADSAAAAEDVSIDLFDENDDVSKPGQPSVVSSIEPPRGTVIATTQFADSKQDENANAFDITADDLVGIEFVPSANRMQSATQGNLVKGNKINFKTILVKGLLWALIGAIIGFGISEMFGNSNEVVIIRLMGQPELANVIEYIENYDIEDSDTDYIAFLEEFGRLNDKVDLSESERDEIVKTAVRLSTGVFAMFIAFGLGLFLGIGEGVFYGSRENAIRYGVIGAGISICIGLLSGFIAQYIYATLLTDETSDIASAFIRGLGWSIMGLGVGIAVGLIRPERRRLLFCALGGLAGGFLGGFVFNYVVDAIDLGLDDTATFARFVGIVVMGLLIGLCIGLLEQFAKQAWLKVIRGDFEGKEYLVFSGTTSIGNNGKNTIVLFKDKLVGPHHCDIVLEGSRYVLVDQGTTIGTVVNGIRTSRHVLRQGDAIAVGNSVLVFNTK
jgi:ubiquitin-protein ligase